MVLQGRITIENLSAIRVREVGSTHHIGDEGNSHEKRNYVVDDPGLPPVRLGNTVVPARVAYIVEGHNGSPSLHAEFEMQDGVSKCTSLRFEAHTEGRGIQTGDLTTLASLRKLGEEAFLSLAVKVSEKPSDWYSPRRDRSVHQSARRDIHTGGDSELMEVARIYRENINGNPVEAVEQEMGYTSRRTAARRIQQARAPEKGLLPPTTRGKKKA